MRKLPLLKLVVSMMAFGTIGLFVKYIPSPRGLLAMLRGLIGALFLVAFIMICRKKPSFESIKKNIIYLVVSGACIGINWILLFESYSFTTVAVSTVCYYMAPIFVLLMSGVFLSERLTGKKIVAVAVAFVGMILVSLDFGGGAGDKAFVGIALAIGAAIFYATVTILNKKMKDISAYDRTIVQLFSASLAIMPYTFICESADYVMPDALEMLLILVVGIVHTGICYALFFSSVSELPSQSVAVFSYVDPVVAVLLSAIVLKQEMGWWVYLGAAIIIAASVFCELHSSSDGQKKSSVGEK